MFEHSSDRTHSILLFVAAAFWGLYWIPLREIEKFGLSSTWSVAFFNLCPLIVLVSYVIWNRKAQLQNLRAVAMIGLMTGIGLGFYASGLVVSSVIRATLLFYLTPIWSTIIGVIWLSEKLTTGRVAAIALGLAGLWLLLSGNADSPVPLNVGDVFALLSGVFWGFGAAWMKKSPEFPTAITAMFQFTVACATTSFMAIVYFGEAIPSAEAFILAFPISFGASTFVLLPSLFVIFLTSRYLFPGRVGVLMMSEALVAIISASLLLPEETMSAWQWVGSTIILTACFVEVLTKDEKAT